jgi:excisionase family DNA binding protein
MTFRLGAQTVRAWIKDGQLPALKLGRRLRIRRSDLETFLDGSWSRPAP